MLHLFLVPHFSLPNSKFLVRPQAVSFSISQWADKTIKRVTNSLAVALKGNGEMLLSRSGILAEAISKVLSCEHCEIFKNNLFYRTPPVAASRLTSLPHSLDNTRNKKAETLDSSSILISFSNMRNKHLLNMNSSTK